MTTASRLVSDKYLPETVLSRLVQSLKQIGAIQFGDFTLKSGQKSSYYFNLRLIYSYPRVLREVVDMIHETVKAETYDRVSGVPTAGIPYASVYSICHDVPMIMLRKERKDHGTHSLVEGAFKKGQTVLLIEDVTTTGASILESCQQLESEGLIVKTIVTIIDRRPNIDADGLIIKSLLTVADCFDHPDPDPDPKETGLIVALDGITEKNALDNLVIQLGDKVIYKVNDAYIRFGPSVIQDLRKHGASVFLDLKWCDIPNTVANYAKIACDLDVDMFTIHCLGGYEMMKAVVDVVKSAILRPKVFGVTVLTSLDGCSLNKLGIDKPIQELIEQMARCAQEAGLDGLVCSPHEISIVRKICGPDFLIITPGIRPTWTLGQQDDQKRVTTPEKALELGANYIVVGRPILKAAEYEMTPKEAVDKICACLT
jgi:orotidine-5'-phosphate decarboxylase